MVDCTEVEETPNINAKEANESNEQDNARIAHDKKKSEEITQAEESAKENSDQKLLAKEKAEDEEEEVKLNNERFARYEPIEVDCVFLSGYLEP